MSEKPPELPQERPTTSVVESASNAPPRESEPAPPSPKREPERLPPPVPTRRPAPAPAYQPPEPTPAPTAAPDAGKAWRILSHVATIRGWAIVWLVSMVLAVLVRETLFVVQRYLYFDTGALRFLYDLLPLTLLLLVIGAFVVRRAAHSILIEFDPRGPHGPEAGAARTAATWAMLVLACAVACMAIRYVTEYSVLSGKVDLFYFDLQYRLETWLHRILGIFVVVAAVLLLQRMGPVLGRQRAVIDAARRQPLVAAGVTYAPS